MCSQAGHTHDYYQHLSRYVPDNTSSGEYQEEVVAIPH